MNHIPRSKIHNIKSCMDVSEEEVTSLATPSHRANEPLLKKRFIDQNAVEICGLCTLVVDAALLVPCCKKIFCSSCLCFHLADVATCPGCSAPLHASNVVGVCSVVGRLMGNWTLRCDFYKPALAGCPVTSTLRELKTHIRSCIFNPATSGTQSPIRTLNLSDTCEQMLMASPSKLRGDVGDRVASQIVLSRVIVGNWKLKPVVGASRRRLRGEPRHRHHPTRLHTLLNGKGHPKSSR